MGKVLRADEEITKIREETRKREIEENEIVVNVDSFNNTIKIKERIYHACGGRAVLTKVERDVDKYEVRERGEYYSNAEYSVLYLTYRCRKCGDSMSFARIIEVV